MLHNPQPIQSRPQDHEGVSWHDGVDTYGWISIGLHWTTGVVIVALLFTGMSVQSDWNVVRWHTSIAVSAYVLLWARVIWRLKAGHPAKSPRQGRWGFRLGKLLHSALVFAILAMIVTGPLMAWTGAIPLHVFGKLAIPSPLPANPKVFAVLHRIHATTAAIVGIGVLMHVAGVIQHIAFQRDETLDRILSPKPVRR